MMRRTNIKNEKNPEEMNTLNELLFSHKRRGKRRG
jgi:hypothetical protein